ncbi:MAG: hypothetical protein I3274_03530 [Candidatus Moeniiplasma glomeromycotorum]|nr:hypothetical protein [Candidatus Moeniiplasma glomeromycotorum]
MNQLINNQITESDINTRKELWDSLFLFVNFQGLKSEFPNMWNKDYKLLPLANSYKETREKLTKYCKELNGKLETLINSFNPYFQKEIYPVLNGTDGDKTLLFRCDRLLKNKILGESASLFVDLIIWEIEYRQVREFKDLLANFKHKIGINIFQQNPTPWRNLLKDFNKINKGRINYSVSQRFYQKWTKLVEKDLGEFKQWQELEEHLKQWEQGKGVSSKWKKQLTIFQEQIEVFFLLGSESISDGKPFFQLGFIKSDTGTELTVSTQNRKGFSLNNPSLTVINFHQNYFRFYRIENHQHINPRNLYVELNLAEDWVWKDYPSAIHSLGGMESSNHPVYHRRNLG